MTLSLSIRSITDDDLDAAYAIERVSHPVPWSQSSLQKSFNDHAGFALIQHGQLIGFAFVQRILDEAHLLNMVIDPACRGRGYGRYLLNELMQTHFSDGINIWFLEVRVSNHGAIGLYQSLGYNELGLRRNYYEGPAGREDALMMACTV